MFFSFSDLRRPSVGYLLRMEQPLALPDAVPVMPLSGALLFPHALLPLYILESRYQEMLAYTLR